MKTLFKKAIQESNEVKLLRSRLIHEERPKERLALLTQIAILKDKINDHENTKENKQP